MRFVLLAAALLIQTAAPPQAQKVSGRIIREDPNAPLQNSVRLTTNAGRPVFATPAADGTFEFASVPPGTYEIVVGPQVTMTPVTVVVADKDVTGLELRVPAPSSTGFGNRGNNQTNNSNINARGGQPFPALIDALAGTQGSPATTEQLQALIEALGSRGGGGRGDPALALKQITVYDRQGKVVSMLADPVPASFVAMSPNGARVLYAQGDGVIMALDPASKTAVQITTNATGVGGSAWAPDGNTIAYLGAGPVGSGIYLKPANGTGGEVPLFPLANSLFHWSMDGRFIITGTGSNFSALTPGGDRKSIVLFSSSGKSDPRLSPDSRFLAYVSNESGSNQIWVRGFDPNADAESIASLTQWKITTDGALGMVRWRNDGKELYYMALDGTVMAIPISSAPGFNAGKPVPLFHGPPGFPLQPNAANQQADVSADGQRFVFLAPFLGPPPSMNSITNSNPGRGGRGNNNSPNNNSPPNAAPPAVASTGVVAGRVTLPDGAPAAQLRIRASAIRDNARPANGTWVTTGFTNSPWTILLSVEGNRLTGSVSQIANNRDNTLPIDAGSVDGNTVSFKVTQPVGNRLITFTGTVQGDEMTLSRRSEILPGGTAGGNGVFGSDGPAVFTARRAPSAPEIIALTDMNGPHRLDRLTPGLYQIRVGSSETPASFLLPGDTRATESVNVNVRPNETLIRDLTLSAPAGSAR